MSAVASRIALGGQWLRTARHPALEPSLRAGDEPEEPCPYDPHTQPDIRQAKGQAGRLEVR